MRRKLHNYIVIKMSSFICKQTNKYLGTPSYTSRIYFFPVERVGLKLVGRQIDFLWKSTVGQTKCLLE